MRKRLTDLESGEARRLAAVDAAKSLGDEGAVLLALAAGRAGHEAELNGPQLFVDVAPNGG